MTLSWLNLLKRKLLGGVLTMGKYESLAKQIIEFVGGQDNINSLTHCITRLRFKLKDLNKVKEDELKALDGVVTTMTSAGQYQVVIGNHVGTVYEDVMSLLDLSDTTDESSSNESQSLFNRFIDIVSGCFQPFLGALSAGGMIKGFNALFLFLGWYSATSGTYLVLNAIGDAIFFFMPIIIGFTAANKFKLNPFVGLSIGAAMCYPAIQKTALSAGDVIGNFLGSDYHATFMGLPFLANDYTNSVIPVILIVWFASYIQRLAIKVIPEIIQSFFVPFVVLIVSLPIGFLVIGPIITVLTSLLGAGFQSIYGFSPLFLCILIGFVWQLLVIFGLHWSLIPLSMMNLGMYGYDNVLVGMFGTSFAQTAVVMAMYFKFKAQENKQLCIPAIISGLFGVTEPAIYGITLPRKKPFIFSMIGGAAGGAILGLLDVKCYTMGGFGFFGVVNYINPETKDASGMYAGILAIIVSMLVGFLLTYFFWKDTDQEITTVKTKKDNKRQVVMSPITGEILPLSECKDEAFASGLLGHGVVIKPSEEMVYAPFDGVITTLFPTRHAIGITSEEGMEVLIHIGIDTVQLAGKYFEAHVTQGQQVSVGELLVSFDKKSIEQDGYSIDTPIIVTNSDDYRDIIEEQSSNIVHGDTVLTGLIA